MNAEVWACVEWSANWTEKATPKVQHLNGGTMSSPGAPLICHVLLIETDNGLVLVDSGFGLLDCADPADTPFAANAERIYRC